MGIHILSVHDKRHEYKFKMVTHVKDAKDTSTGLKKPKTHTVAMTNIGQIFQTVLVIQEAQRRLAEAARRQHRVPVQIKRVYLIPREQYERIRNRARNAEE